MSQRPKKIVRIGSVLVQSPKGFVLQQRESTPGIAEPGTVSVFGGSVEHESETLLQAAHRELLEETSLRPDESELQHICTLTYDGKRQQDDSDFTCEFAVFLYEIDTADFEVHEGLGPYVLPFGASLKGHNLSPITETALMFYLEKVKDN